MRRLRLGSRPHEPLEAPVFLVRRPSDAELSQIAASVVDAPVTYDEVAATAHPDELPEGNAGLPRRAGRPRARGACLLVVRWPTDGRSARTSARSAVSLTRRRRDP